MLTEEPPELVLGRVSIGLEPAVIFNRDVRGRRLQVIAYPHPAAWARRRLPWPRSGLWPIFRTWQIGPVEVRRFLEPPEASS